MPGSTTEPSAVAPDAAINYRTDRRSSGCWRQLQLTTGSGATALGSVIDSALCVDLTCKNPFIFPESKFLSLPWHKAITLTYDLASMTAEEFRAEHIPVGYLITIRAYGTWLHGTAGSVDRFHNRYGTPRLAANEKRRQYNRRLLGALPVTLGPEMRNAIELGIKETCEIRNWTLWALNARTNHVHSVVTAPCKPKKIVTAFKANATRKMREAGVCSNERSPWVGGGGSKKYLWTEKAVSNAVAYVLYDQGEPLPE